MKVCEICGYERPDDSTVIIEYPDGFTRCKVCADIAAHGRYISRREIDAANEEQLDMLIAEFDSWMETLRQ